MKLQTPLRRDVNAARSAVGNLERDQRSTEQYLAREIVTRLDSIDRQLDELRQTLASHLNIRLRG